MDIRTKIGSQKFFKAADLARPAVVAIAEVAEEVVGQGRDAEEKVVLYFSGTEKGLVLNSTNANAIADLFGFETGNWIGGKVELFADKTAFAGKIVDCVRVRKPSLPAPVAVAPVAAPADALDSACDPF